jgi:hypothetical protein
LNLVLSQGAHKTFGHFAALRMARAQKQHSWFIPHTSPIEDGWGGFLRIALSS